MELLQQETSNVSGDATLEERYFTSLIKNTQKESRKNETKYLPAGTISKDEHCHGSDKISFYRRCISMSNSLSSEISPVIVLLHCE